MCGSSDVMTGLVGPEVGNNNKRGGYMYVHIIPPVPSFVHSFLHKFYYPGWMHK